MTNRNLAEVGARLEEAISNLPEESDPLQKNLLYLVYEQTAIAILDCEFENYAEGVLEEYLKTYLALKRMELGVCESELQ